MEHAPRSARPSRERATRRTGGCDKNNGRSWQSFAKADPGGSQACSAAFGSSTPRSARGETRASPPATRSRLGPQAVRAPRRGPRETANENPSPPHVCALHARSRPGHWLPAHAIQHHPWPTQMLLPTLAVSASAGCSLRSKDEGRTLHVAPCTLDLVRQPLGARLLLPFAFDFCAGSMSSGWENVHRPRARSSKPPWAPSRYKASSALHPCPSVAPCSVHVTTSSLSATTNPLSPALRFFLLTGSLCTL